MNPCVYQIHRCPVLEGILLTHEPCVHILEDLVESVLESSLIEDIIKFFGLVQFHAQGPPPKSQTKIRQAIVLAKVHPMNT